MSIKELGKLQDKVLFYLAENPNMHKQAIQKGIGHPTEQYGAVLNSVKALEKLGYIKPKTALSKKEVIIKTYSCTDRGVLYALAKNPSADIKKILSNYKGEYHFLKFFDENWNNLDHELFSIYLRSLGNMMPIIEKEGIEKAFIQIFLEFYVDLKDIDLERRINFGKKMMKYSPNTKKHVEEMKKSLEKMLKE